MARLKHRIPVSLRQNWKVVAACGVFLAVCAGVFGSGTIRPYVTGVRAASGETVVTDLAGGKDLFGASAAHEVKITFTDASYEDMLAEYFKSGEKNYVEADLVIDGTTIPSVGIRLKGNSTLMGLTWKGQARTQGRGGLGGPGGGQRPEGAPEGAPEGFQPPEGARPPEGAQQGQTPPQQQNTARPGGGQGGGPGAGFGGAGRTPLKAEEPENLPWLISFDEFVEGRRYQGHSQIAVRPVTMGSATLLKESLAISMVDASGEPSQGYAYSSFSVNGRPSAPRLLVEYLDEGYAERLGDGVLYKSLASSTFSYKGEDQTQYTTDFKQINRKGEQDLQPVIDLVKWVEQSSDAEFASGLASRLDVESFARYLALQNMLLNFDDMAGPGRNYYLWYDLGAKRFKVITWDLNLAFGGDATAGPDDTIGRGGPGGQAGGDRPQRPGGQGQGQQGQQGEQGRQGQTQGQNQPQPQPQGQGQARERAGGGMRMGHALKERFLKTPAFTAIYQEQYQRLYQDLLVTGKADTLLEQALASYQSNQRADAAEAQKEATSLRTTLATRTKALGEAFAGKKAP
ncbi:Spore coat protein CotH [Sinosporangium album]|uniref:Spore coat protein CotH n=1 Tax=Sinosporangium album TaxID=504805 RepID=A0A1G8DD98_9ACTN|nr:CotH kinase family protein [Sinosporangium album]SDH55563.1 Spore coat protein CotH [Sinosporangium album]